MFHHDLKNILVPTDGSNHAQKAFELAVDIATKFNSKVTLLHVYPEPIIKHYTMEKNDIQEPLREEGELLLYREIERVENHTEIEIEKKLVQGSVSDKIIETAHKGNYDLITMGHSGLGLVQELVLGSVTRDVARRTRIPLLIVR